MANLAEIEQWYKTNRAKLPKSMGCSFMIVRDVDHVFSMTLKEVNEHVKRHGKAAREVHAARAALGRLQKLYEMARDETTHNTGELKSDYWRKISNEKQETIKVIHKKKLRK